MKVTPKYMKDTNGGEGRRRGNVELRGRRDGLGCALVPLTPALSPPTATVRQRGESDGEREKNRCGGRYPGRRPRTALPWANIRLPLRGAQNAAYGGTRRAEGET